MKDYNLKELIPVDKFDLSGVSMLMEIDEKDIKPIIPDLLLWTVDMNWPVATEMVKVLVRFPDIVIPYIKKILSPSEVDEEWKWFIIVHFIPKFTKDKQEQLLGDIRRICDYPTDGEIKEEVQEEAKSYLKSLI